MNKKELVEQVAKNSCLSKKKAEDVVDAFIQSTQETLAGKKGKRIVQLIGFGTFSVVNRKARQGRNPRTSQKIAIPACKLPHFKPGIKLRKAVNYVS